MAAGGNTVRMLLHLLANSQDWNFSQDEVLEILSNKHYSPATKCLTFALNYQLNHK